MSEEPSMVLRGTMLRYVLVRLIQLNGVTTMPELLAGLQRWGFAVEGRPSKTVSDALRWERRRGRVIRCGRGRYIAGDMPRSTEYRIFCRVAALREEALSLRGGHKYRWSSAGASDAGGASGADGVSGASDTAVHQ